MKKSGLFRSQILLLIVSMLIGIASPASSAPGPAYQGAPKTGLFQQGGLFRSLHGLFGQGGLFSQGGLFTQHHGHALLPPAYSATDYMFAMPGVRQANKFNTPSDTTATKAGVSLLRVSPAYPIQNYRFFFPNYFVQESNVVQEAAANLYTIEAVSVIVNGTLYTASTTLPANVDPAVNNGGLMISVPTGVIPPNSTVNLRIALSFPANTALPTYAQLRSGETTRMHDTSSFASAVNSTGSIAISGSVSSNWNGFLPAPVYVTAQNADGRPVVLSLGDSIAYGKGQYNSIEPASVTGIVPNGMNENVNSKQWLVGDMTIAGSGPDPNPGTMTNRVSLLSQNGNRPFNFITSEHGNNTDLSSLAAFETTMQGYITGIPRHFWPGVPIVQTTLIPKATSTDGFRTLANQVVGTSDSTSGTRWLYNDWLLATNMGGYVDYAVSTAKGLSYDQTLANRDKIKVAPFTAQLTQPLAAGSKTLYLNAAPSLDTALCLDPINDANAQNMIVVAVAPSGNANEWQVTMNVGSSGANFTAKPAGTLVGEQYFADGVPSSVGLHPTARADDLVAQATWVPFKNGFSGSTPTTGRAFSNGFSSGFR